jgi:hypothetical protein
MATPATEVGWTPHSRIDVPIVLGSNADIDACANGLVVGLDPNGDGFLSVRSGPGGRRYHEVDRLFNGNQVFICERNGPWYAAIYNDAHEWDRHCGVSTPWVERQSYTGPCRYGWIHSHYVQVVAG